MAKILVAEDERDIRDLIEFTLDKVGGHEVITVTNGADAVSKAPEIMPDIILLDIRMPKMTGVEACKALKENEALGNIPIVFLSAHGQETEIDAGLGAGAFEYIVKPFAPDQLARRVDEILAQHRASG
ncbi:MAG: response regulator transcription factor [Anaerolineales bacterium]